MYYVKIKDVTGREITVSVSHEVFLLFEGERKEQERERNERRRHLDKRGLDDYILANESFAVQETLEDLFIRMETLRMIRKVVSDCTPVQQRRFSLYAQGYTFTEIARLDQCSKQTVQETVRVVLKKIKRNL